MKQKYVEKAPVSMFMRLIGVLAIGGMAASAFFAANAVLLVTLLLVACLLAFAFLSFASMSFELTHNALVLVMPPFSYRVPFASIRRVHVGRLPWYTGWGLRTGWGRLIIFVSQHKPAVIIEKSGVFRRVMFTPRDPQRFAALLKQRVKKDG